MTETQLVSTASLRLLEYGLLGVLLVLVAVALALVARWYVHALRDSNALLAHAVTQQRDERIETIKECRDERETVAALHREERETWTKRQEVRDHDLINALSSIQLTQSKMAILLENLRGPVRAS